MIGIDDRFSGLGRAAMCAKLASALQLILSVTMLTNTLSSHSFHSFHGDRVCVKRSNESGQDRSKMQARCRRF